MGKVAMLLGLALGLSVLMACERVDNKADYVFDGSYKPIIKRVDVAPADAESVTTEPSETIDEQENSDVTEEIRSIGEDVQNIEEELENSYPVDEYTDTDELGNDNASDVHIVEPIQILEPISPIQAPDDVEDEVDTITDDEII